MTTPDLLAIAEILGHDNDCPSLLPEDNWEHEQCTHDGFGCTVWETGKLILKSENLNRLLAAAWDRGFSTCQHRVGQQLLDLLPRRIDATNPYQST